MRYTGRQGLVVSSGALSKAVYYYAQGIPVFKRIAASAPQKRRYVTIPANVQVLFMGHPRDRQVLC